MPHSIVCIPAPLFREARTELKVKQRFGRELIVNDDGDPLCAGEALLVEATLEEVAAQHPSAYWCINPMCGPWYPVPTL
ncbi:hypothetical protein [Achromobacter phage Motura]|uniref:Uncharacterized protein n=1 Tax=Achromobacter phage Motura TaxID=2591403 RepID=A0A514CSV0_9CAUD|nr:hypothetical protein H1O15_gp230 [Achromobacter phage Motura]QDH83558.1 hypothetical protein [Achromobacter phage Motura]